MFHDSGGADVPATPRIALWRPLRHREYGEMGLIGPLALVTGFNGR